MVRNPQRQKQLKKVLIIALCWTLFLISAYISEYFGIMDLIALKKLSGTYNFWPDFIGNIVLGVFGGLLGGYFLVFKLNTRYRYRSFAYGILNSTLYFIVLYLLFAVIILLLMAFLYYMFQIGFLNAMKKAWHNLLVNLYTPSFFIELCVWGFMVSVTQFMLQVSDKFGPGILWKFITGKYYHPKNEERIFMFLDLKSSTAIAEKIGNNHFFEFLNEIYREITEPIIYHLGEIYQYVGDEVVVSWKVKNGLKHANCLRCFFAINQLLETKKELYLKKYDEVPSFKAGLHIGEATVGEIGVIKKDIVFSGDVLNTTSRIQGECNHLQYSILISSELHQRLPAIDKLQYIPIGKINLRGKSEIIELFTVEQSSR